MGSFIRMIIRLAVLFSSIILWRVFKYECQHMAHLWKESKDSVFKLKPNPTTIVLPPLPHEQSVNGPQKVKRILDKKKMVVDAFNAIAPFLIFVSLPLLWVALSYCLYGSVNLLLKTPLPKTYQHLLPMTLAIALYGSLLYGAIYHRKFIPFVLSIRYSVLFTCWKTIFHLFPHYHQGTHKVTWDVYTDSTYRTQAMVKLWNYTQSYKHLYVFLMAFAGLLFLRLSYALHRKGMALVIEKPITR